MLLKLIYSTNETVLGVKIEGLECGQHNVVVGGDSGSPAAEAM